MWTLASLCIVLTIGRYAIRYRVSLRFYKDDLAHLCALGWLIVFCAITQAMFAPTHVMLRSQVLGTAPPPATISEFCRLQTAQGATFYLLHWTVKLAFLLFYRELFWVSRTFIRAWWCVSTFVFLGLGVALAGIMTQRGPINRMDDPSKSLLELFQLLSLWYQLFVLPIIHISRKPVCTFAWPTSAPTSLVSSFKLSTFLS